MGRVGGVGRVGRAGIVGISGSAGRAGRNGSPNHIYAHLSQSIPHLFPLFPPFPASVVSYPTPNPTGCWVLGRVGRVGIDRNPNTICPLPQSLPNLFLLFPLFPVSKVSVVSYPTTNQLGVGNGVWGVVGKTGKTGKEWEDWGEIGALTLFICTLPNLFEISPHSSLSPRFR